MGIITSKQPKIHDQYHLYDEEMINVYFVKMSQLPSCSITPEQFNVILGLNIPKYFAFEIDDNKPYPYIYCIPVLMDINKIADEYGYRIGFISKQKVFKSEFNANHEVRICYDGSYKLVKRNDLR